MICFSPCVYCGNWNRVDGLHILQGSEMSIVFLFLYRAQNLPSSLFCLQNMTLSTLPIDPSSIQDTCQIINFAMCFAEWMSTVSSAQWKSIGARNLEGTRFDFSLGIFHLRLISTIWRLIILSCYCDGWREKVILFDSWRLTCDKRVMSSVQISFLNFRVLQNTSSCTEWCKYQRVKLKSITEYRNWTA